MMNLIFMISLFKYFYDIFSTSTQVNMDNNIHVIHNRVPRNMVEDLSAEFTPKEVVIAMKSTSSPGPDGLPTLFYQTYWQLIGIDVLQLVLNILNNGGDPTIINHTYINLIPKNNSPQRPSEYRPISLCNVILKIITKTITNRVKKVLPLIVSDHQSAFLSNRLITNNILVAFEAFHKIHKTKSLRKVWWVSNWIWPKPMIGLNGIFLTIL